MRQKENANVFEDEEKRAGKSLRKWGAAESPSCFLAESPGLGVRVGHG